MMTGAYEGTRYVPAFLRAHVESTLVDVGAAGGGHQLVPKPALAARPLRRAHAFLIAAQRLAAGGWK